MEWGDSVWTAVALVLLIEGLVPFVSPAGWRRMFSQLLLLRDAQVRFFALLSMVTGMFILLLI